MGYRVFAYNNEDIDNTPRSAPEPLTRADIKIDPASNSGLLILTVEQDGSIGKAVLEGFFSYNSFKQTALDIISLSASSLTYYTNGVITQRELFDPPQDPLRLVFGSNKERDEFFIGDDEFVGSPSFALDDLVLGNAGNDRFTGYGSGQFGDYFDGELGYDLANLWGYSSEYQISSSSFYNQRSPNGPNLFGFSVIDRIPNRDGLDRYTNVEQLVFSDISVELSYFTKTAQLSKGNVTNLVELYIASFNRAPDAMGLNYWGSRLYDGMPLEQIAKSFFVQPETVAAYPVGQATATFVTTVYNNVLSRGPDQSGLDYWVCPAPLLCTNDLAVF